MAALENRVWNLEQKQKDLSFAVDVSVKHATDNLDWKEIVSPSVEQLLAEKMSAMEKEMKPMQKQIVKLHSRLRELVGRPMRTMKRLMKF